jgi:undecaprenyl-diphosphatase
VPAAIPWNEALVLGAIQGATEFLPISSDGHVALAQMLFGDGREASAGEVDLALTVLLHAGTLGATLVVLRKRVMCALEEGLRGLARPSLWRETRGGRDAVAVLVATIPTVIIGLALRPSVKAWSGSPAVIGGCMLISAAAVASTAVTSEPEAPRDTLRDARADTPGDPPGLWGSLLVGLAQGLAVLPGLSRSAMALTALLWLGVRRERAFELAFMMSIPAVLGAIVLEGRFAFHGTDAAALILGTAVAFALGTAFLRAMRRIVIGGKLALFAFYLVPLAIATLAWGYARP